MDGENRMPPYVVEVDARHGEVVSRRVDQAVDRRVPGDRCNGRPNGIPVRHVGCDGFDPGPIRQRGKCFTG